MGSYRMSNREMEACEERSVRKILKLRKPVTLTRLTRFLPPLRVLRHTLR